MGGYNVSLSSQEGIECKISPVCADLTQCPIAVVKFPDKSNLRKRGFFLGGAHSSGSSSSLPGGHRYTGRDLCHVPSETRALRAC